MTCLRIDEMVPLKTVLLEEYKLWDPHCPSFMYVGTMSGGQMVDLV